MRRAFSWFTLEAAPYARPTARSASLSRSHCSPTSSRHFRRSSTAEMVTPSGTASRSMNRREIAAVGRDAPTEQDLKDALRQVPAGRAHRPSQERESQPTCRELNRTFPPATRRSSHRT